uniref:VASt domain-containing protein n=1 Tax=Heterosigma akashiwo TaxID=2829 RepID=A0A7S4D9Y7_HETAK
MHYHAALQWALGVYQATVVEEQTCWLYGRDGIIFQIERRFGGIPAKDSFSVRETWVVRPGPAPKLSCRLSAGAEVRFRGLLPWAAYVDHKAREDARAFHRNFAKWIADFIDQPITSKKAVAESLRLGEQGPALSLRDKFCLGMSPNANWTSAFLRVLPYGLLVGMWCFGPHQKLLFHSPPPSLGNNTTHVKTEDSQGSSSNYYDVYDESPDLASYSSKEDHFMQAQETFQEMKALSLQLKQQASVIIEGFQMDVATQAVELKVFRTQCERMTRQIKTLSEDLEDMNRQNMGDELFLA